MTDDRLERLEEAVESLQKHVKWLLEQHVKGLEREHVLHELIQSHHRREQGCCVLGLDADHDGLCAVTDSSSALKH